MSPVRGCRTRSRANKSVKRITNPLEPKPPRLTRTARDRDTTNGPNRDTAHGSYVFFPSNGITELGALTCELGQDPLLAVPNCIALAQTESSLLQVLITVSADVFKRRTRGLMSPPKSCQSSSLSLGPQRVPNRYTTPFGHRPSQCSIAASMGD